MSTQCIAIAASTKQQCRNNAKSGHSYCARHMNNNPQTEANMKECAICMEDRKQFKVFPCKHEICSTCLGDMRSMNCPFCRSSFESILTHNEKKLILNKTNKSPIAVEQLTEILTSFDLLGYFLNDEQLLLVGTT